MVLLISVAGVALAQSDESTDGSDASGERDLWWDAFDDCYRPDWIYDPIEVYEDRNGFGGYYGHHTYHLWYCQARPLDGGFIYPGFTFYDEHRGTAQDHALLRCERHKPRCVTRCALLPRVCKPHFWQ
jgi:hypothetical protein